MLFDLVSRADPSPQAHEGETSFVFLNRVNTPFWEEVRQTLEAWFGRYPAAERDDLRRRFRSKIEGQHRAAWWELYLHELFMRLGYDVELHPALPDSNARPDFRLRRGDSDLLIEATVVFSGIVAGEEGRGAPAWLVEAIDTVEAPGFFVMVKTVQQRGNERLKRREVAGPIQTWLDGLDPDKAARSYEANGELPRYQLQCRGWEVSFEAVSVKAAARGKPGHRVYGGGPAMAGYVDDVEQLYDKLRDKAGRYGRPQVPLLTAVLCTSAFMESHDIEQALYGREAVEITGSGTGGSRLIRQPNGFWYYGNAPVNQRVSAVLTGVGLHHANVGRGTPSLWINPWANYPFAEQWPFPEFTATERGKILHQDRDPNMAELFGLSEDWPGGKPFPRD
jgi:hypothetical protein